ncbi:MAG: macro domain-containing protein [Clostridia bacterium]|nr:macro domain-containing protein [Clostridia bacterium]
MPLYIVKNDITKMKVDAIVNAANESLLGGGGVDGAIHAAAGRGLLEECRALGGCRVGEAKMTGGYNLPASHVIHTVGPRYKDGRSGERSLLEGCYRSCLLLAKEQGFAAIAFPLISSGAFGYPRREALGVAIDVIGSFLLEYDMTVYVVVYGGAQYIDGERLYPDIAEYIEGRLSPVFSEMSLGRAARASGPVGGLARRSRAKYSLPPSELEELACSDSSFCEGELGRRIRCIDESFSEMLLRKIDEKGMTDVECYKRANVDRKLFSKIRSDRAYRPSKPTAIAFAISLELSLGETEEMLRKAGFALSKSSVFDIIIEYFISKKIYNIHKINEALFAFDQSLLGV